MKLESNVKLELECKLEKKLESYTKYLLSDGVFRYHSRSESDIKKRHFTERSSIVCYRAVYLPNLSYVVT